MIYVYFPPMHLNSSLCEFLFIDLSMEHDKFLALYSDVSLGTKCTL